MTLCSRTDVPLAHARRVYRNQSWRAVALVAVFMLGVTLMLAQSVRTGRTHPILLSVPGGLTLLLGGIAAARLRAHLRPGNWLAADTESGLYINLRSHLNDGGADGAAPVLFIPAAEVAAVVRTSEVRTLPYWRGNVTDQFSYIDVFVRGDGLAPVREALRAERRRPAPPGWLRRKHDDYPVRVLDPPCIRLVWDWIRPAEKQAAAELAAHYPTAKDRTVRLPEWRTMTPEQRDALVAELWESGHAADAVRLVRMERNVGERAAREYVHGLVRP